VSPVTWMYCVHLFPYNLFEVNVYGKQNFRILHNKVIRCPAMTVRASLLVAGESLMSMIFQKQIFNAFRNLPLTMIYVCGFLGQQRKYCRQSTVYNNTFFKNLKCSRLINLKYIRCIS
jgi:hypothetical protein